jgi:hypothetical protein
MSEFVAWTRVVLLVPPLGSEQSRKMQLNNIFVSQQPSL